MYYLKHITKVVLLMLVIQMPINASDVENSIMNDLSGVAHNLCDLSIMAAKGLLRCGQTAIGLTRDLTGFMKKHPVIACTLGLSAYAAWRVMKCKYGNKIYCTLSGAQPHAYYYCPSCGHISDAPYSISY